MIKELTKYQITFSETSEKESLIYQKLKEEETATKKAKKLIET